MMRMMRLLAALMGSMSVVGCNFHPSPDVTPQNHPGFHLESRPADTSFQISDFKFNYYQSYYYRNPGPQQPYSQTTKVISAIFFTKVFEHQQKLGWCGGFAVADNDASDLRMVGSRMTYFSSYMEVDNPESQPKPRIWTGPFTANKSNRLEDVMTSCAVTAHPWLPSYQTAKLSVHLRMDFEIPSPNSRQPGGKT
jgi:hypothetical protein